MAHSSFSKSSSGSSSAGGSNVMFAKAGNFAVAIDDLLYMNGQGYVFPAQTTAWAMSSAGNGNAGTVIVPETGMGGATTSPADVRQALWVNPLDLSVFVMTIAASGGNPTVHKFSAAGALLGTVSLDNNGAVNGGFNLLPLSNGNLVAVYAYNGSSQKFNIIDTDLNMVVPATVLTGPASGAITCWCHAIALKDGGFAVAVSAATSTAYSVFFGVYSNTGAPVRASSAVPSTSMTQNGARIAQLSNGNIAMAIAGGAGGNNAVLGYAIFNSAGAAVLGYTVANGTYGSGGQPDIAVVPGFFCIGVEMDTTNIVAYVVNNAGAVQGGAIPLTQYPSGPSCKFRIKSDGAYFWLIGMKNSDAIFVRRISTNASVVVTEIAVLNGQYVSDFFIERDMIVLPMAGRIVVMTIRADGYVALLTWSTLAVPFPTGDSVTVRPGGDFTMVSFVPATGSVTAKYRVLRYLDVCVLGVSQTALAANNKDASVRVAVGPSVQRINPLPGPAAGAFDSSTGRLVGNKGYLLQNSVSMKGY